jgi:phage terminase large subunit GpA-like protein
MNTATRAILTANALAVFAAVLPAAALNATGNPADWARKNRYFAPGESPLYRERTKFTFENAPWSEEPCIEAVNPEVQTTVLWLGSNMAKTGGILMNVIGWTITEMPSGILVGYKTQDQSDKFSKNTLTPGIENTPILEQRIAPAKSRDSNNTISHKKFEGGYLSLIGTESIVGFRLNRAAVVIGDEIDSWEGNVGIEGDPVDLLLKRSDGFPHSIRILASTGTTKGRSRIAARYQQSDQRKWFVPCRECGLGETGRGHLIMWKDIQFPKGPDSRSWWACPECHAEHTDKERREAVKRGKWHPTAPFNGIRGYWLNGLNSLMPPNKGFRDRLHQWAKEWTDANNRNNPEECKEAKKVFIQTVLTELWEDEEDAKPDWAELRKRVEKWEKIPRKVTWLTVGVDVHPDRIEATLDGWGHSEENWTIEHAVFKGEPREPEVWNRLEGWVNKPRDREDKCRLIVRAVGVDTGHPPTQRMAYAFIRPRQARNWFALKGSSMVEAPIIVRPKKSSTVDRVTLLTVGGHRIKGLIYDRCAIIPPAEGDCIPGTMHFHHSLTDEWFQQLLSETSTPVWKAGNRLREFKKPTQSTRNEALDCKSYSYAAYIAIGALNLNHDAEDKRLVAEKDAREAEQQGQETYEEASPVASGGFLGMGRRWTL